MKSLISRKSQNFKWKASYRNGLTQQAVKVKMFLTSKGFSITAKIFEKFRKNIGFDTIQRHRTPNSDFWQEATAEMVLNSVAKSSWLHTDSKGQYKCAATNIRNSSVASIVNFVAMAMVQKRVSMVVPPTEFVSHSRVRRLHSVWC